MVDAHLFSTFVLYVSLGGLCVCMSECDLTEGRYIFIFLKQKISTWPMAYGSANVLKPRERAQKHRTGYLLCVSGWFLYFRTTKMVSSGDA